MQFYILSNPVVLEVSGQDAKRYLNNRLSNDFRNIAPGQGLIAAALTPQGRTEVLFNVLALADKFIVYSDAGDREEITKIFARYKVADRVNIVDRSDTIKVVHLDSATALSQISILGEVPRKRLSNSGKDLLIENSNEKELIEKFSSAGLKALTYDQFQNIRLAQGFPQFPDEINDESIILETGPAEAVAFGKGCYVGQEVLERVDSIGRLPKALVRVRTKDKFDKGMAVTSTAGKALGEILSASNNSNDSYWYGFGLVKSGTLKSGDLIKVGQVEGEILP